MKKSLGYGCDEGAIRLVKEGPEWDPAERDGLRVISEVTIRIKFQKKIDLAGQNPQFS